MKNPDISDAILKIYPASSFQIEGTDLSTLKFLNDSEGLDIPTQKQIDDALTQIIQEKSDKLIRQTELKKSAQEKLTKLGLTSDEITSLLS